MMNRRTKVLLQWKFHLFINFNFIISRFFFLMLAKMKNDIDTQLFQSRYPPSDKFKTCLDLKNNWYVKLNQTLKISYLHICKTREGFILPLSYFYEKLVYWGKVSF